MTQFRLFAIFRQSFGVDALIILFFANIIFIFLLQGKIIFSLLNQIVLTRIRCDEGY